jgi:hypothetical protein
MKEARLFGATRVAATDTAIMLNQCPLLGVKRTSSEGASMSAFDPKAEIGSQNLP